jgi:inhibitor of KinA
MNFKLVPLGDQALIIELADRIEVSSVRRIHAARSWLAAAALPGVRELVPAATTLTLFYSVPDLVAAGAPATGLVDWLSARVRKRLSDLPSARKWPTSRLIEVPVCYGGEFGPDLADVAARVKLSPDEVIARHSGTEYFVLQLGFAPGFPYLHGLPQELSVPRRETPRIAVRVGSVAIANGLSGIYPVDLPGGWNLIGRTPLKIFRPDEEPPVLFQPGDRVKFRAITQNEFANLNHS